MGKLCLDLVMVYRVPGVHILQPQMDFLQHIEMVLHVFERGVLGQVADHRLDFLFHALRGRLLWRPSVVKIWPRGKDVEDNPQGTTSALPIFNPQCQFVHSIVNELATESSKHVAFLFRKR